MKRLAAVCVVTVVCFSLAENVEAVVSNETFVSISVSPDKVDLGTVKDPQVDQLLGKLKAHIVANCPHFVEASFDGFAHLDNKGSILPKHVTVAINGAMVKTDRYGVVVLSSPRPTPVGGVEVPLELDFTVMNAISYPAGTYGGVLTLTVMPGL
jgi:hypothetical protein